MRITLQSRRVFRLKGVLSWQGIELVGLKKEVVFCNIYAANVEVVRKELWDYICNVQVLFLMPWCIGEDFNMVFDPSEQKRVGCNLGSVRNFNSLMIKAKVVNLSLLGIPFTQSNNKDIESWARLDRFLISTKILAWFPSLIQKRLSRSLSNHNAILL
ncbi:hypothetical protein Dsin_007509 [Dipteronia sinensis]|uniref:Endonuclease/exonuclease/phosphatase domain-containing protein n=1 Tax=Dipteronia sinensis TaxID=43782 RepID=A0AAE0EH59_9ROSI|nr:hypothetical protein Dsin_007509 [Dipteronia sinensis]